MSEIQAIYKVTDTAFHVEGYEKIEFDLKQRWNTYYDDKGAQTVWNIECSTPNILVRKGWSINSFKPGDMIKVIGHPMHDGGQAALLMTVTTASGAALKDHDY